MTAVLHDPVHPIPAPLIETKRLILRGPLARDFEPARDFMRDPLRTRYVGGPVEDDFSAWRVFMAVAGHWMWRGYGFWTVEDRASGRPAGRVGMIYHFPDWPEPELGWHVFERFEGKGIAFEAAMAVREHCARIMGLDRPISQIHPDNARSRALAERMGAEVEREAEMHGDPVLIYRHPSVLEVAA